MTAGTIEDGVAVVMPAFREEANLTGTVEDMLTTLDEMGEQHLVVVVNDGSDDRTGEVADELAARYPGRVHVVHHEVNKGYGAAVRTGIATALEHTDVPWIFLTDSDGQFRGAELPWFVAEARTERADAVIGFRPRRADPAMRKVNAWLWTRASGLLLGVGARDVDCAYKLVGRRVLDGVQLHGDAALISPELLMKIRARDARILQRPVRHYPRVHGEQTGAKLSVILISLLGLVLLSLKRMEDGFPGRLRRAIMHPSDPVCTGLTALSAAAAVVFYLVFSAQHALLDYPEAARDLLVARGISEGLGLSHVGSVWLPGLAPARRHHGVERRLVLLRTVRQRDLNGGVRPRHPLPLPDRTGTERRPRGRGGGSGGLRRRPQRALPAKHADARAAVRRLRRRGGLSPRAVVRARLLPSARRDRDRGAARRP